MSMSSNKVLTLMFAILSVTEAVAQDNVTGQYSDGMAMVSVEKEVCARTFFIDNAPNGYLKGECEKVYDSESVCNKGLDTGSFKNFIEFYSEYEVKRRSHLYSNYSNADDEAAMERVFRMTVPYFKRNKIVPIEPKKEETINGVKNYTTFFAVGKNRVGYKTVVSFDDNYMIAILGFVRFDGIWYLTESHVGFLDYPE